VPVLDLERLAGHRGSAYGGLGLPPQPPQEAFAAAVAAALAEGSGFLVEDEGPFIGSLTVPAPVHAAIESAPVLMVSASREARIERLTREYGGLEPQLLIGATQRIRRRLGGSTSDRAISHFAARRPEAGIAVVLPYFDAAYEHRWALLTRELRGQIGTD
jgi:tRNA 2-selenouridine synthase